MKVFYIDTSSNYLYLSIFSDNKIIAYHNKCYDKDLSKVTILQIEKLFNKAQLKPQEIDKIIVVSGPGSFTGIRIGMTFAKVFAWSLNKKITTITSLDAMAASCNSKKYVVPIIDARRGYVYAGVYKNNEKILENQYIALEDLINYLNKLDDEYNFVTNNPKFNFDNILKYEPNFLNIINLYLNKKDTNAHLVEPDYLKLTEAEEKLDVGNDN